MRPAPAVSSDVLTWVEICARYPREFVCVDDVTLAPDGSIDAGVVLGHGSLAEVLAISHRDAYVANTASRPWWTPRGT